MKTPRLTSFILAFGLLIGLNGYANDLGHIDASLNSPKLQGSGRLTWWGLNIYDASFYRSKNSSAEFALDLRYQKSFSGSSIANRSADEMKKIGVSDMQAVLWGKELAAILPNVESGQALTAIYSPKQGTVFYHDGKQIGKIPGADFSKAFFGIWFDPNTSAPKLRTELLGRGCPPPIFNEACTP
jgi:hypothetical protein